MIFKIYNCDFGFKLNGVDYNFSHVAELQIESARKNRLTRGANGTNKVGITYTEGMQEPDRWTIPIIEMSIELKAVLDSAFKNQTRLEPYCIDRTDGSSKMMRNAILCNKPQQLAVSESVESLQVSLEFESFDTDEVHKT